jgi:PKHD-type hydroxylase
MLLTLDAVLDAGALTTINAQLDQARFVDGRASAGRDARRVKRNEELPPQDLLTGLLNEHVLRPLHAHPVFQAAALPARLSGAFFARYQPGMVYGAHVDDPIMGPEGGRYRTDVSITVFLTPPDSYEGGELVIHAEHGEQRIKAAAGSAVIYPSGSLHAVAPVTRGERRVAVAWAQSMVRSPEQRRLLYELHTAASALREALPQAQVTQTVQHVYINLIRLWADI